MSVPDDYKDEKKLRHVFGDLIRRIWITSDCKELKSKVNDRDKTAFNLETAETKFIRRANKARNKAVKNGEFSSDTCLDCESSNPAWSHKVKRPTHRLKFFFGEKVDSINWYRKELAKLNEEVAALQKKHQEGQAKYLSALFIEFNTQSDAQIALQTLSHHQPFHMTPRFIGVSPREVVWSALNLSWWQRIIRKFAVQGGLAALVIFWSFPAAIVGTISNISYLSNLIPPLKFIEDLPDVIKGAIEGLLPSAALVALMSLVPIICRGTCTLPLNAIRILTNRIRSLRATSRSSLDGTSGVVHTECPLCLPGRASISGDDLDIGCISSYVADYQGSPFRQGPSSAEPAQSNQLLHLLFPAPGVKCELNGSGANCQRARVQVCHDVLRLFSAPSVHPLG